MELKIKKKAWIGTVFFILIVVIIIAGTIFYIKTNNEWNLKKQTVESIEIKQSIIDDLNELYRTSNTEFVWCLNGKIENEIATIESYYLPDFFKAEENDISFSSCKTFNPISIFKKEKYLGTVHNHISGICHLGYVDCYTFGKTNDAIAGVICGEDNINFFSINSLLEKIELKIS